MQYAEAVMSADWSAVEKGVSLEVNGEAIGALGDEENHTSPIYL